jgi:hypothetical protein
MTEAVRDRLLCAIGHALLFIIQHMADYAVFGSAYTELKEVLQLSEQKPDTQLNKNPEE